MQLPPTPVITETVRAMAPIHALPDCHAESTATCNWRTFSQREARRTNDLKKTTTKQTHKLVS